MATIAELQIKVDASQADTAATKLKGLSTAVDQVAKSESASTKSKKDSGNATDALLSKIDAQTRSLKSLAQQQAALNNAKSSGAVDTSTYDKYNAIIQQNVSNLQKRGNVVDQQNAKEMAASAKLAQQQINDQVKAQAAEDKRYQQALQNLDKRQAAEAKAATDLANTRQKSVGQDDSSIAKAQTQAQRDAAKAAKDAQKAYDQESVSLRGLQKEFAPVTSEMNRLIAKQEQVDSLFKSGRISTDQYTSLTSAISKQRTELDKNAASLQKNALTAGQLRQANQLLPAQFTDIVVSLQGGQKPLTVLLQQGGQLKDSFGGVGAALKGMAGYVAGLINPLTVAGAAATAFAIGIYQGQDEIEAYNKSLILTGNYSGQTAGSLNDLAHALAGSTGSSVAQSAAALNTVAASGKIASDQLSLVTTTALNMQRSAGTAIADTVAQFVELGKDPVAASEKLNDSTHYLTASMYERIAALVASGDEDKASELAQNAYAEAMNDRAKKVVDNLGYIQTAFNKTAKIAREAWDGILNIGRDSSLDSGSAIADAISELTKTQAKLKLAEAGNKNKGFFGTSDQELQNAKDDVTLAKQKVAELQNQKSIGDQFASFYSTRQKQEEDSIAKLKEQNGWHKQNLSDAEKTEAALKKANDVIASRNTTRLAAGQLPLSSSEEKTIRDDALKAEGPRQSKKKSSLTLDDTDVNDIKNRLEQISSAYKKTFADIDNAEANGTINATQASSQKIAAIEKEKDEVTAAYNDQIAALNTLKNTKGLSASQSVSLDKKIADARSDMTKKLIDLSSQEEKLASDEVLRNRKREASLNSYRANLQATLDTMDKAQQRALQGLGQGDSQKSLSAALNAADDDYNSKVRDLTLQGQEPGVDTELIKKEIDAQTQYHTQATTKIVANYNEMQAAQQSWEGGFAGITSAYQNFTNEALNLNANLNSATASTFSSFSSYITSALTSGETSFKDFTKSVLSMLTELLVKMALVKAIGATIGAFSGGTSTAATSLGSTAAGYSSAYFKQAKGGGWSGGTQFFANGGAFTNSVVSSPTAFATGSGLGVMGEAGPEAIMPLTRTSDGSLGVKAVSTTASANGMNTSSSGGVNVYISIASDGTSSTSTDTAGTEDFGKEIGAFVDSRYKQLMNKGLSQGGDIYKAIKAG